MAAFSGAFLAAFLAACLGLPAAGLAQDAPAHQRFEALARCGYEAYGRHDDRHAISCLKAAFLLAPNRADLAAQIAYAYRRLGENAKAKRWFETAWRLTPSNPVHPGRRRQYALEIEALSHPLRFTGYVIHQSSSLNQHQLALAGSSLTQSQGAFEVAWRPPGLGFQDSRIFELYGRVLEGLDGTSSHFEGDSLQSGLGARWKPFRATNFWLAGERLIKLGSQSTNAWMGRASWSASKGYGLDETRNGWTYATIYLDAALIRPSRPDLFTTAEGQLGESFKLWRGSAATLVTTPHVMVLAVRDASEFGRTSLLEAGPGVDFKLWLANGAHGVARSSLDLTLEYRWKVGGNSSGGSGLAVTAVMSF